MSSPLGGSLIGAARSLGEGFVRSFTLLALTGLVPGVWILAAVFFFELTRSTAPAFWCVLGVAVGTLVVFPRPVCRAARSLVARWTGTAIPDAYRPLVPVTRMATGYWWNGYDYQRLRWVSVYQRWILTRLRDPASWRDMLWILIAPVTVGVAAALPLALVAGGALGLTVPSVIPGPAPDALRVTGAVVAIVLGTLLVPLGWRFVVPVARRLLGPSAFMRLSGRVATLVQGRADLTQAQGAELHRIERNLHDGAQARLIAIGLSLSEVERLVDTDPVGAKGLLRQTRENSLVALEELRELTHGIAPSVLLERGLVDAIRALALDAPVRTVVTSTLDHRPAAPTETALYFATSELLTNAVKHSRGSVIEITIGSTAGGIAVTVADDGRGGASLGAGSGLAGIRARLDAFDGALHVDSPTGGPTRITLEVPCGSS